MRVTAREWRKPARQPIIVPCQIPTFTKFQTPLCVGEIKLSTSVPRRHIVGAQVYSSFITAVVTGDVDGWHNY